jgi:hypothetical protein
MRKDAGEFIRRLDAVGLTVESSPGHYRVLRDGRPLRKANGMPFTLLASAHNSVGVAQLIDDRVTIHDAPSPRRRRIGRGHGSSKAHRYRHGELRGLSPFTGTFVVEARTRSRGGEP